MFYIWVTYFPSSVITGTVADVYQPKGLGLVETVGYGEALVSRE